MRARMLVLLPLLAASVLPATAHATPVWTPASTLSPASQTSAGQRVAVDPAGNAATIWTNAEGSTSRVQVATRPAGGAWSAPVDLSAAGRNATRASIATDDAGDLTAVWISSDGTSDRAQASTRLAGGTWSTPVDLSAAGTNTDAIQIATNPAGDTVVGWVGNDGTTTRFQVAARAGANGTWKPAVSVSGPGTAGAPQLAIDASGDASAVWWQAGPGAAIGQRIQFAARTPNGVWQSPIDLSDLGGPSEAPDLATDAAGNLTAVWDRYDGSVYQVQAAVRTASGTWSAIQTLTGSDTRSAAAPSVAMNAGGNTVAAWSRVGAIGPQRVEAATRTPAGHWGSVVTLSSPSATAVAVGDQVAVDPRGNAVVVWAANADGAQRIQAATQPGTGNWSDPVNLTPTGITSSLPSVALDGSGNGVAAWSQSDGSRTAVQASGLDNEGPRLGTVVIPTSVSVGITVAFSVEPFDVWSPITSVSWTFGDGSYAAGNSATHAYASGGLYDVIVTVTDAAGSSTTQTSRVTVPDRPSALPAPAVSGTTPTTKPSTPLSTKRVPTALKKTLLTVDLDLARTGKACPSAHTVITTLRARIGKRSAVVRLAKRRFTVIPSSRPKVCTLKGTFTLRSAPAKTAKLTLSITSRTTRSKSFTVTRG